MLVSLSDQFCLPLLQIDSSPCSSRTLSSDTGCSDGVDGVGGAGVLPDVDPGNPDSQHEVGNPLL